MPPKFNFGNLSEHSGVPNMRSAERTLMCYSVDPVIDNFSTWGDNAEEKFYNLSKNRTIQKVRVAVKSIPFEPGKHHREIYDRLVAGYESGNYLADNGLYGRYMCNLIARLDNSLTDSINTIRFELFIENLLLKMNDVLNVPSYHITRPEGCMPNMPLNEFGHKFYQELMVELRKTF